MITRTSNVRRETNFRTLSPPPARVAPRLRSADITRRIIFGEISPWQAATRKPSPRAGSGHGAGAAERDRHAGVSLQRHDHLVRPHTHRRGPCTHAVAARRQTELEAAVGVGADAVDGLARAGEDEQHAAPDAVTRVV